MTRIIKPILESYPEEQFRTSVHRFYNLFAPIQKTDRKESDYLAYIATPIIDSFILEPAFALDASIHMLNAIASLCKALQLWTLNQKHSHDIIDSSSKHEFNEAGDHLVASAASIVANTLNSILSIIALITRPIASVVHAISHNDSEQRIYREQEFSFS